jgi:formylglycine-generating enzyme required for sulfatase activity
MKPLRLTLPAAALLLASCGTVDLNAPIPVYETGVDPNAWALVPAGEFLSGQHNEPATLDYNYQIMLTDVTVGQYVMFLNEALGQGVVRIDSAQVVGFYPGDEYHGLRHEVEIAAGDYLFVPLNDPVSRFTFDDVSFAAVAGYENHPMTNVSWFGAWGYCGHYGARLPLELEWEKAARGAEDDRPFPWGDEIGRQNANFYVSRDPFEDMGSFGSRTSPVGFYNGRSYDGYATLDSASPYGLYDMAGNVWQWVADIQEGSHYRMMRGGSKADYAYNLRIWTTNSAGPDYASPSVGFRCAR